MSRSQVAVHELRSVSVLFDGDLHDLALWLLRVDNAMSTATSRPRHTLQGVATAYQLLTRIPLRRILDRLEEHALPPGATVEFE